MLAITINDTSLDLAPRTRLRYTLDNPIFDPDGMPRGYSFPFRIPATARNLRILGYANRLDIRDRSRKYAGQLHVDGVLIETGIVQITGAANDEIEIVLKNDARDLLDQISKLKVRELVGTVMVPQISTGEIRYRLENTTYWLIRIDDNTYSLNDAGATPTDAQFHFLSVINADYPNLVVPHSTDQLDFRVHLHPTANLKVSEWVNVTYVSGDNVYEGRQINVQTWVNGLAANPIDEMSFPTIYADYFHDGEIPGAAAFINYYHDGNNIDNVATGDVDWNHSYVPFVRIRYLLSVVIQALGYTPAGSLYTSEWIQQLLYYTNKAIDDLVEGDFGPGLNYFNSYLQSIPIAEYIPDISGTELLSWIQFLNYYFEIEDNELRIHSRVAPLRRPPVDWTDITQEEYAFDLPERTGFRLEYATIEGEHHLYNNHVTPYGSGENQQVFPVRPIYSGIFGDVDLNSTWAILATDKPGSSETIALANDNDVRIALDRGLQTDQEGLEYVYGSSTDKDSFNNVAYNSSLILEGDNGVFKSHWEGWVELIDAPTVRRRCRLTPADILDLKQWKNPMRYIYHPQGATIGVIKRVSLQIDEEGISAAEVEFILKT